MTRDAWLAAHSFLEPVARFSARVETVAAGLPTAAPGVADWRPYLADFEVGIPLLRSPGAALDLEPVETLVDALIDWLALEQVAGALAEQARALRAERTRASASPRVVDWLLGEGELAPSHPGLLRYLGWTAMTHHLSPLLDAFAAWRGEDRWLRSHCPTCGALPAMAQLVGVDPGKKRFLACGCCRTRWRYKRTACPFCEHDTHRLGIVGIAAEPVLRIVHCESCRGYLKTYDGQGEEALFLADWSSLHLDVVAQERGLERRAVSLYELAL